MPPDPADTEPFLRSPPFPWVDGKTAAVASLTDGRVATRMEAEAAIKTMRVLGVGGDFWTGGGEARARATLAAVRDDAGLHKALIDALTRWRYRDPFTGGPTTIALAVELLGEWRRMIVANRGIVAMVGMAQWKHQAIRHFLWSGDPAPGVVSEQAARAACGTVAYWPSRVSQEFARDANMRLACVEDGFVRSNGIGADCRVPSSIVVDRSGIYFDPSAPSDLERILASEDFTAPLLDRAARLRERMCALKVTKYGIASGAAPVVPTGRRVVLAVGQVDDDLSVRLGGGSIAGNAAFLARVRAEEPGAYILYRPHPDVLAGHRSGHVAEQEALRFVDAVSRHDDLLALVECVDAVHVLSSLTGFEALLRGRDVIVHGVPFYAGWGLTRDLAPMPARRTRRLTIDMLVAGALIRYPRYLDPVTGLPCSPEILIERMAAGAAAAPTWLTRVRRAQGRLRRGARRLREALA